MLANIDNKMFYIKFDQTNCDIYNGILYPLYLFIDYSIFGTYSRHSMLYLLKHNMIFINNKHQENIYNKYIRIYGDF